MHPAVSAEINMSKRGRGTQHDNTDKTVAGILNPINCAQKSDKQAAADESEEAGSMTSASWKMEASENERAPAALNAMIHHSFPWSPESLSLHNVQCWCCRVGPAEAPIEASEWTMADS
jgi:hypothetical protein